MENEPNSLSMVAADLAATTHALLCLVDIIEKTQPGTRAMMQRSMAHSAEKARAENLQASLSRLAKILAKPEADPKSRIVSP